jgi:acetyltransferase-like isoleucine patch superfamily enzyme
VASTPHGVVPLGHDMLILDGVVLGESSVVADGILVTG